jgi:tol-pal system protein YbgF
MKSALWVMVALGFCGAGCFYPSDRGRALEARVEKLQNDNIALSNELRTQQQRLEGTLPKVEEKVGQMTAALDSLEKGSRRSDADIGVQLQKTLEDLSQLRGQVETYLHKIGELEGGLKQTQEEGERRMSELKGTDTYKLQEARKKVEELSKSGDKKEILAVAKEKSAAGDTAVARVLYSDFMKKWPKDDLVGEAHYGLGETFFSEDKCREALYEYGKVVQEFPRSKIAPDAYLRSSDCFSKLKMIDEAKLALEELQKGYPKSEAAKKARAKLEELKKKSGAGAGKKAAKK